MPLLTTENHFPLIQGPLAGVSCAPFRVLIWKYSNPAFCCTEMISCKTLIHRPKSSHKRFVYKDPREGRLCFQLSASNPQELGQATQIATDYGADLIDLNCGCPVKKIRSKQAGSHLLSEPSKIYQLIRAMKNNTDKPVSIKIRVDAGSDDRFNEDIVKAVADAEADFITVHGRNWRDGYDMSCSYRDIQFFVEHLKIPVIGNGDIACLSTLKLMQNTGCAGGMIGRTGVGQPWLIEQLYAESESLSYSAPSNVIRGAILIQHIEGLIELMCSEKFALTQARTFAKYYARTLEHKTKFYEAFNRYDTLDSIRDVITSY
ncbi:MAG: tRNA dihydrouridine synthase, partial [Legionellales bacterium]